MADSNIDESQWELSKENIQPIKQGRRATILTTALNESQQRKLNVERQKFEQALRSYSGDDPLDIWYKYAVWVEQNYPKGGNEGNLIKLLENCFSTLGASGLSDPYNNDERYFELWVKYISICPCPLEVYQTLSAKNMFLALSSFFESWAWEMEKIGNLKKANAIYLEGIQRKAQPISNLEMAYSKFQARVARLTLDGLGSVEGENGESEVQRKAFAALKPRGAKAKAPNERVSTVIGTAGRLSSTTPKVNSSAPTFKIFKDENDPCNQFPVSESVSKFTPHTSSKENTKDASVWSKNKTRQKTTTTISVEDVNRISKPGFNVHVDDSAEEQQTHHSGGRTSNFTTGILSARKAGKDDWHVPLFIAEPFNPHAQPQYVKHMVYCGVEEFSFEELRAIAVKKEEEKKMRETREQALIQDELRILREKLLRQEELISSLLQKNDNGRSLLPSGNEIKPVENRQSSKPTIMVTDSREGHVPTEKASSASTGRRLYEDSYVVINNSVSFAANATQNASHAWDESTAEALSLQPAIPNVSKQRETELLLSVSGNRPGSNSHSPQSGNNSLKDCNRSLTVNTKYAQNLISDMFNGTLFRDSSVSKSSEGSAAGVVLSEPVVISGDRKQPANPSTTPFVIYEDNPAGEGKKVEPASAPFSIYCDEIADIAQAKTSASCDENDGPIVKRLPLQQLALVDEDKDSKSSKSHEHEPPPLPPALEIYQDENDAGDAVRSSERKALQRLPPPAPLNDENEIPFQIPAENAPTTSSGTSSEGEVQEKNDPQTRCKGGYEEPNEFVPNDENQENIPPEDYRQPKQKRSLAGILQPSKDIYFEPLEEPKVNGADDNVDDDEMEGVTPLSESCVPDDFTIKVPANKEAFAQMACMASTPRPYSFGCMPPSALDGDDFTLPAMIKSGKKRSDLEDVDDPESQQNSGELMPPPSKFETPESSCSVASDNPARVATSNLTNHNTKNNLSPIMEASREYRSSSSSSSGIATSFAGHSNFHGITHVSQFSLGNATKSINISSRSSQHKQLLSYGENESSLRIYQDDVSKSGYFADKSKGESMNEASAKKSTKSLGAARAPKVEVESWFDADEMAGDLLSMDVDISDMEPLKPFKQQQQQQPPSLAKVEDIRMPFPKKQTSPLSVLQKTIEYPPDIDPFCPVLQKRILNALKIPVKKRGGYIPLNTKMPQIKPKMRVGLGKELYQVRRAIGSGAYAQIFHASTLDPMNVTFLPAQDDDDDDDMGDEESQMILKVQKPASFWEFYICHELRERLKHKDSPDAVLDAFMRINRGYFLPQGSILVSQFHKHGTLLDVVNKYKKRAISMSENMVFFLMSEVVLCLEALHSCNVIHGDLKPDNVLLVSIPQPCPDDENVPTVIKLIDFGRSIDMEVLPRETEFTRKVKTDGFATCEMRDGRSWTFQTDYYGLAAIAHIMLWGSYMNVKKDGNEWKLSGVNYYRYMQKAFWQRFFNQMLNIPSCQELPNLKELFNTFRSQFSAISFSSEVQKLENLLAQKD